MATVTDNLLSTVQSVMEGNPDFTARDVADVTGLHVSSARTAIAVLRSRGTIPRKPSKWADLIAMVQDDPELTCDDLARMFKITRDDVSRILSRHRSLGVKIPHIGVRSAQTKDRRSAERRADILGCVRSGISNMKEIARITGHSHSAVHQEMHDMQVEGVVKYLGWVIV